MMLIKLIVVGKIKEKSFAERCAEYQKRLGAYAKVQVVELNDGTVSSEANAIYRELNKEHHAELFVLSEEGREFSTVEIAEKISRADCKLIFVIGGPFGLDEAVKKRAKTLWSLSKLTFTHEMARMILLEQLYRVFNYNAGGNYHHQ
jgi:23S rRNA (pseudouridine1915-N3)-methyltransferase